MKSRKVFYSNYVAGKKEEKNKDKTIKLQFSQFLLSFLMNLHFMQTCFRL